MNHTKKYAGFWVRLGSLIIDGIVLLPFEILILTGVLKIIHPFVSTEDFLKSVFLLMLPIILLVSFLYYSLLNSNGRQTIGKKYFHIIVNSENNTPISIKHSLFRTVLYFIDSLFFSVGHLVIFFTKKKQTLHDLIVKTNVVRTKERRKLEFLQII